MGVSVNEEMLPQGFKLAGAALCQLACVAKLQINASDRVCVPPKSDEHKTPSQLKTYEFSSSKASEIACSPAAWQEQRESTSQHPCVLGSPASPASHTFSPHLCVCQCWLRTHCFILLPLPPIQRFHSLSNC